MYERVVVRNMSGLSSQWLTSLDGVGPLWDELAEACPTRHPQYFFDWLEPWWRHIGSRDNALSCVRVLSCDHTIAVAPLMLVRRRTRALVSIRTFKWLATDANDQSDVLARGDAIEAGVAVAEHLCRYHRYWDELHLKAVPEASSAVKGLLDTLETNLKCTTMVKRTPSYFIDTSSGDWEDYLATTSKKFVRRDLPRVCRRLNDLGKVEICCERGIDSGELVSVAAGIHRARQDELGRASGLADTRYRTFQTEAFQRFQRRGVLSPWILRVGGSIGAYLIGFESGRVFYAWNMAHDPTYGSASPGKVLWASVIQRCFEDETIDEFNMMRGDTAYKLKWTDTFRYLLDIRVRNLATARSLCINRLRRRTG